VSRFSKTGIAVSCRCPMPSGKPTENRDFAGNLPARSLSHDKSSVLIFSLLAERADGTLGLGCQQYDLERNKGIAGQFWEGKWSSSFCW
jgi:hypothetical protein